MKANTGKTIKLGARKYKPILTKEERTKINKTNKDRARRMEQRIATYLRGKRTPMSGAGTIKGDVLVHTDSGMCVVSCKLSAALSTASAPYVPFKFSWFDELYKDVQSLKSLGAQFGILVVHWHGFREDMVFIPIQYLPIITTRPLLHLPEYDMRYALNGKPIKSMRFTRELALNRVNHIWKMGNTSALLFTLSDLRDLINA